MSPDLVKGAPGRAQRTRVRDRIYEPRLHLRQSLSLRICKAGPMWLSAHAPCHRWGEREGSRKDYNGLSSEVVNFQV